MATLIPGQQLTPGQRLNSDYGLYSLTLQADGNFVLYRRGFALWATWTQGKPVATAVMQNDGNLVLYDSQQHALWNSGTAGHPGAYLAVQDDGNVVIYVGDAPIWQTGTHSLGTSLTPMQKLTPGQALSSTGGLYTLTLQTDGNFVLYRGLTPLWATWTQGKPVATAVMQNDGDLVLYDNQQRPLWNSGSQGHPGALLTVQDDGNVVVYLGSTPLWWTRTNSIGPSLGPPGNLTPGQSLTSNNRRYNLVLQLDGNFVLYQGVTALWATWTQGKPVATAIMQNDGNLVLYDSQQHPLWNSGTEGHPGALLTVQDDGNVVVGLPGPFGIVIPIWTTKTAEQPSTLHAHVNITFDDSTPVGGWSDLTLQSDGSYVVSGHLHDSGFPDYNFSVVWAVRDNQGVLYTFPAIGGLQGTQSGINPNREADWGAKAVNAAIVAAWKDIPPPGPAWVCRTSVVFDINALVNEILNDVQQVVGVVVKVIEIVGTIVAVAS